MPKQRVVAGWRCCGRGGTRRTTLRTKRGFRDAQRSPIDFARGQCGAAARLLDGGGHFCPRGKTLLAILFQRFHHDGGNGFRNGQVRFQLVRRLGWSLEMLQNHLHRSFRLEGQFARQHTVHDNAERVEVGAAVDFIAALPHGLLGRHVLGGANHHAGLRQPLGSRWSPRASGKSRSPGFWPGAGPPAARSRRCSPA